MADTTVEAADKNVEIWKVKKLIKSLEAARGNGTSMISLIIPPGKYRTPARQRVRLNSLVDLVLDINLGYNTMFVTTLIVELVSGENFFLNF